MKRKNNHNPLGRASALIITGALTFALTHSVANRDGNHWYVAPLATVGAVCAANKLLDGMQPPQSQQLIEYHFNRLSERTLQVRVFAMGFERCDAWCTALKRTKGINWTSRVQQQVINGQLVWVAAGSVDDTDELSFSEQNALEHDLTLADVKPVFKLKPTLAYLELCRHSAQFNPPETSFHESIQLAPEFLNKRSHA
jgi:hypothetical protein